MWREDWGGGLWEIRIQFLVARLAAAALRENGDYEEAKSINNQRKLLHSLLSLWAEIDEEDISQSYDGA